MNTGLLLYGKYTATAEKKTHQYTLISLENIRPESKRVAVYRKLFGFTQGKKSYAGIAKKTGALKIGKGALLVPAQHVREVANYLHNKKVPLKLYDVWSDEELAGSGKV